MPDFLDRITINPDQCCGRPCIRGLGLTPVLLSGGFTAALPAWGTHGLRQRAAAGREA